MDWINYEEELPISGEEVLAFNENWIDEFNPRGFRIGFRIDDDFVSAHWWNYQDCYITVSHAECDNDSAFSDKIKNSIEPRKWRRLI